MLTKTIPCRRANQLSVMKTTTDRASVGDLQSLSHDSLLESANGVVLGLILKLRVSLANVGCEIPEISAVQVLTIDLMMSMRQEMSAKKKPEYSRLNDDCGFDQTEVDDPNEPDLVGSLRAEAGYALIVSYQMLLLR